jgi:hypothetical protein
MKLKLVALLITLAAISAVAQKEHVVTIPNERLDELIADRTFYIDSVIDHRANKENIGQVLVGPLWTKHKATTNKELATTMMDYYTYGLPSTNKQIPVTVLINKFWLMETLTMSDEKVVFQFDITYVVNSNNFYQSTISTDTSAVDVTDFYEQIIRKAIKQSLIGFNNSNCIPQSIPDSVSINQSGNKPSQQTENTDYQTFANTYQQNTKEFENRNIFAIGYQIGGFSLIGFEYEFRLQNYVGLNLGLGFAGYTAGLKLHTSPKKNSPFVNINFKDGGFGAISTFGIEIGKPLRFSKSNDLAFHWQLGLASIISIDDDLANDLFGNEPTPSVMPTIGIGLSW